MSNSELLKGWKESRLDSLIEIKYGKDHKLLDDGDIPVYGSGGVMRYANQALYNKESILIPRKGTLENIFYIDKPFWTVDTIFWSKIDSSKIFGKFLFYKLKTLDLASYNVGSAVPSLTTKILNEIEINIPPLAEQKAIAEVLSSLDDKIDLLHQQNQTLEDMAQTLFREWFIEKADEGWEEVPLSEVCNIINGYAFKSKDYIENGNRIIRTKNFSNGYIELNDLVYLSDEKAREYEKFNLQRKDFLLVMVGASIGNQAIVTNDIIPSLQNQNMWNFRAFDKGFQNYLNYSLKDIVSNNLASASGSAREFFQKGQFYNSVIKIPSSDILKKFDDNVESILLKVESNREQIKTLEQTRDTLLPKLMSGQVRV